MDDALVREGGERIMCHAIRETSDGDSGTVEAGPYPLFNRPVTKSGQPKGAVKVKDQKVHAPIGKPVVLEPYETRMIVPLYEVSGSGLQAIMGNSQIACLLFSVLLRKTSELGIQVFNSSNESKYLSQKLTLAGIVLSLDTFVSWY